MKTPKLEIQIRGEVVASNIGAFRAAIAEALGDVNLSPETDEEFGQAELDATDLKAAEQAIDAAKEKALADAVEIHALLTEMDEAREEVRQARLTLERRIKDAKAAIKARMIEEAIEEANPPRDHLAALRANLDEASKARRTVETLRTAVAGAVDVYRRRRDAARAVIERHQGEHGGALTPDEIALELWDPEKLEIELARRVERAEAERRAKEAAAAANADRDRLAAELAAAKVSPKPAPEPDRPSLELRNEETPEEEWARFEAGFLGALGALKPLRESLVDAGNIARAKMLAEEIGTAWKRAKEWGR
jgi:hypothetical protein